MKLASSALFVSLFLALAPGATAGSATWSLNPVNGNWSEPLNWTPQTVPNGAGDVATFGVSNLPLITAGSTPYSNVVSEVVFNPGASAYTFTTTGLTYFAVSGVGITNNSGVTQNFVATNSFGTQFLTGSASAGTGTVFTAAGPNESYGGRVQLTDTASGANATFVANCGLIEFDDHSSADHATLIAYAAVAPNYGGSIEFHDGSDGAFARVEVLGNGAINSQNGRLNLIWHTDNPNVTIGSLEGNGEVVLWDYGFPGSNLTVGTNDLSTNFGGVIHGGTLGSLTKVGKGTLTLSNANYYGLGTTITGGMLLVRNAVDSATGSGPVTVRRGRLGGTGTISGAVTVGAGRGHRGAVLTPGNSATTGTLTIQSALTFNSDALYDFALNSSRLAADQVVAAGVAINGGSISYVDNGTATLPAGTVFTLINNTAATPIAGTFSNLADGATVVLGSNTYSVNYEGGDGNDLTLTVQ